MAVAVAPALASPAADAVKKALDHKVILLRHPLMGGRLHLDQNGAVILGEEGHLPLDGILYIDSVSLRDSVLKLDAERLAFIYPSRQTLRTGRRVKIEIEVPDSTEPGIAKALQANISTDPNLMSSLGQYWQVADKDEVLRLKKLGQPIGTLRGDRLIYAVDPKIISPPKPILVPDPEYSQQARRAGIFGTVLIEMVVNEKGFPEILQIKRSLGAELDTNALKAATAWQFKPATKDGVPVSVLIDVEFNFRM